MDVAGKFVVVYLPDLSPLREPLPLNSIAGEMALWSCPPENVQQLKVSTITVNIFTQEQ